jgi:hypothetical protein
MAAVGRVEGELMQVEIALATAADDVAIRGLCRREAIPGKITVRYEREPDFSLGCSVTGDEFQVVVARDREDGEVVGVACRSTREMFVNGLPRRIGYLGQLRVDQRFRGRWLVSRGFSMLRELHEQDPVPGYLVSMVGGNREAEEILVRKARKSFPSFHCVADFQTLAISLGRAKAPIESELEIVPNSIDQISEVVGFLREHGKRRQFFPVWTEDSFGKLASLGLRIENMRIARRDGRIVGTAGLWDQSSYKQTVIQRYSGWLKAAAPVYNVGAPWMGRPALPRPGAKVRSIYAAFVCIADDDPRIFSALLRNLHESAREQAFEYLLIGLDVSDPLLAVARKYDHVLYPSRLYLAEWPDGGRFHEQLERRTAYVDIATL